MTEGVDSVAYVDPTVYAWSTEARPNVLQWSDRKSIGMPRTSVLLAYACWLIICGVWCRRSARSLTTASASLPPTCVMACASLGACL